MADKNGEDRKRKPIFNSDNLYILSQVPFSLAGLLALPFFVASAAIFAIVIGLDSCTPTDWVPLARSGAVVTFIGISYVFLEKTYFGSPADVANEIRNDFSVKLIAAKPDSAFAVRKLMAILDWSVRVYPRVVAWVEYILIGGGTLIVGFGDLGKHLPLWMQRILIAV